nr:TPA_asm: hypothetical protein [Nephila orb-weaver spider adintovirus]
MTPKAMCSVPNPICSNPSNTMRKYSTECISRSHFYLVTNQDRKIQDTIDIITDRERIFLSVSHKMKFIELSDS